MEEKFIFYVAVCLKRSCQRYALLYCMAVELFVYFVLYFAMIPPLSSLYVIPARGLAAAHRFPPPWWASAPGAATPPTPGPAAPSSPVTSSAPSVANLDTPKARASPRHGAARGRPNNQRQPRPKQRAPRAPPAVPPHPPPHHSCPALPSRRPPAPRPYLPRLRLVSGHSRRRLQRSPSSGPSRAPPSGPWPPRTRAPP